LTAFDDHDEAYRYGLQINGDHYDVHRYENSFVWFVPDDCVDFSTISFMEGVVTRKLGKEFAFAR